MAAAAERTDYTYTTLGNTASVSEYADTDHNPDNAKGTGVIVYNAKGTGVIV
ncbi:MAG: hypothetical protein ABSH20_06305 [Tepidisphaeraceae bacterium]|jgi:hypothetical protein